MNRTSVTSESVASVGYDANTMTLEVEFTRGPVYQYFDVPGTEYRALVSASSVGTYLNKNIKSSYRYARV